MESDAPVEIPILLSGAKLWKSPASDNQTVVGYWVEEPTTRRC